jgi:putative membrane protein
MTKFGLLVALAIALFVPAAAVSATHSSKSVSEFDKYWLKSSAQGDAFEIKGGKIAESKGTDASVKSLGATLVKDHSKSLSDAKKVAAKLGIKLELKPTPSQNWELSAVQSMGSGKPFDQWYAKLEVQDHIQDIQDATEAAKNATNPAIRAEAKKDLPVLRKHLALAKAALKKVS